MCSLTTRERQTVACDGTCAQRSTVASRSIPAAAQRCAKTQGSTAAIAVAAPNAPFFALKSTSVDRSIGTSDTPAIYTVLTDVTVLDDLRLTTAGYWGYSRGGAWIVFALHDAH